MALHPNRIIPIDVHTNFPMGAPDQPVEPMYQTASKISDEYCGPASNPNCFGAIPTLGCSANRAICFVIGTNQSTVMSDFDKQCNLNEPAIAKIAIQNIWNQGSKTATGTVTVKFESSPGSGDFRIGLYIVEDSVTGPHPNYSQYDDADPQHWPVQGFRHPWVLRTEALGNSFWGKNGIIPNSPQVNTEYSAAFSYAVPAMYYDIAPKPEHIALVSFVVKRTDGKTGTIYNCESVLITATNTQITDPAKVAKTTMADIRMAQGKVQITMLKPDMYCVSLMDLQGRILRSIKGLAHARNITLDCATVAKGVYVLAIKDAQTRLFVKTILVQ